MSGQITLVFNENATGGLTAAQLATNMLAAWNAIDNSLITVLYGCTITSATVSHAGNQATLTVVINLTAAFLAICPNTPPDLTPFYDLYSAELKAKTLQPALWQTPTYSPP